MIMVKGRGKGKKLSIYNDEDVASGEEEKIPVQKKRGRPLKQKKEEMNDDEYEKSEEKEADNTIVGALNNETLTENGRKRRAKGKSETAKNENGTEIRSSSEGITKSNGFRHIGSRRKNKPCRAAEAGVECHIYYG